MQDCRILPILFNTDMILRILSEEKTETRRIIKPQPVDSPRFEYDPEEGHSILAHVAGKPNLQEYFCPYQKGDILYVRETWQEVYATEIDEDDPRGFVNIQERILNFDEIPKKEAGISRNSATAAMTPRMRYYVYKASPIQYSNPKNGLRWRPSIHMPKEAARIFLEVEDIKVQQLQEITVDDILHEGVNWVEPPPICREAVSYPESFPKGFDSWGKDKQEDWIQSTARATYIGWSAYADSMFQEFEKLWNSTLPNLNKNIYGYMANPWVWVIRFKLLKNRTGFSNLELMRCV